MTVKNGLLSFLLLAGRLAAQPAVELEKIGIEEGLSQGFVSAICQDKEGFLWFGTLSGLNRYDGHEFIVFKNDPYNRFSISTDNIMSVAEAGDFLCVLTKTSLNLYDRRSRRFYPALLQDPLTQNTFSKLMPEAGGNAVWCLARFEKKHRLYRVSWPEDLAARLDKGEMPATLTQAEQALAEVDIQNAALSADGQTLWVADDRTLYARNLVSGAVATFLLPSPQMAEKTMFADQTGGIWLHNANRLGRFDGVRWQHWVLAEASELAYLDEKNGLLWFNFNTTVCGFDLHQLPATPGPHNARFTLSIPERAVRALADAYGIVWFGTDARGICKFNPHTGVFRNFFTGQSVYGPPFVDRTGKIWLSKYGNDEYHVQLNPATGRIQPYPIAGLRGRIALSRMAEDADGNYWLSGIPFEGVPVALVGYRPASGQTEWLPFPNECPQSLPAMRFVAPNSLWIATSQKLFRFDTRTRQFNAFDFSHLGAGCQTVYAIERTPDGSWWLGLEAGLIRAEPAPNSGFQFALFQNNPADRNSLSGNYVKALLADSSDPENPALWIGTAGRGLNRLDIRRGLFSHFDTENGLPDDVIYGIAAEDAPAGAAPRLWLSTNRGLTRLEPRFGQTDAAFRYFFKSDGLQDNEFNTFAYGKTPAGELFFGGVNGLTIFNPKDLRANERPPPVFITSLKINNKDADPRDEAPILKRVVEYAGSIELSFSQNNITLQFVALDFTQPERNRFRFYLEGAEPEWAHEGFEHTAQYLNLPPGAYTFKVKGANSDGIWNDTPVTLRITILPPWYRTALAYLIYALLLGGGAYGFYRFQLGRRLEHAENARLKELDQVKSRIYTNITHEFRTPLTMILGMTEQVKTEIEQLTSGAKGGARIPPFSLSNFLRPLDIIRRNGQNLLALINQLLDLSKLETGKMALHRTPGDIVAFAKYVGESFHSYAATKGIQLHFLSDIPALEMAFDREKIQTILFNLLSNAIKFTPESGHVYLQIGEKEEKQQRWLSIRVKDTGIGIAPEKLPLIFDRFYQADDTATRKGEGTGIGLALVRELVKLMEGAIQAGSQPGEGAVFTVLLPVVTASASGLDGPEFHPPAMLPPEQAALASPPARQHANAPPSQERPLVLLVEDNAEVLDYLKTCVGEDYEVAEARNGREGLERALELVPDLVLSDVMMPEMDGLELCGRLKNDERTSHIPVVLLTARSDVASRIEGIHRGADDYLAKPFDRRELLARLSNLILLRRQLHARYASLAPAPTADPGLQIEDAFLQKIRAAVETHLSDADFEMPRLERALGMSRSQIFRKVRALTGRSPSLFIRSVRLHRAKELLRDTRLSVSEIAYEVGFTTPAYFSTAFQEEFGAPPSAMRQ